MIVRRRGFTLVELMISTAMITTILLILSTLVHESATATKADLARNEAMAAARKIIQTIARELSASGGHEGGSDHVTPTRAAGGTADSITFAMRTGLTGVEANDWGSPITYQLVATGDTAGDNDDDDGDGIWDERQLRRVQDAWVTVLDESVTLFTIERAAGSDMITITVEVSRFATPPRTGVVQGPQDWVRARLSTNVFVRNRT